MKKSVSIIALVLFLAAAVAFSIRHPRDAGILPSDEPPFNAIASPIRGLKGGTYTEAGSVWVEVVDSNGSTYEFTFAYDHITEGYPTSFYDSTKPLANPARARAIVLTWLRQADHRDEDLDRALDCLSGQNRSLFRKIQLKVSRMIDKTE
jgi:hypothetical protein